MNLRSDWWTRLCRAGIVLVIGLCFQTLMGCRESVSVSELLWPTLSDSTHIEVVCSTGMVADLVSQVGGDRVSVTTLMGEGVDPHLYKASPGDVFRLGQADIIFYNGLHLEGRLGEVFEHMAKRKPTVPLADRITPDNYLHTTGDQVDPHVWFDVALWAGTLDAVSKALSAVDPDHSEDYQSRAEAYRDQLLALHRECRQRFAKIPKERRILVTAHDAFGYFGRAYDLEVRAIQGLSTESEAGVREINELVSLIVGRGIKAVFVESTVNDRNIRALVEGCRARGHQVSIGGELFSDAMGASGTLEGTYVGMVRHNVETITEAL